MVKKTKLPKNEEVQEPDFIEEVTSDLEFDDSFYKGKAGEYYINEQGHHVPVRSGHKGDSK